MTATMTHSPDTTESDQMESSKAQQPVAVSAPLITPRVAQTISADDIIAQVRQEVRCTQWRARFTVNMILKRSEMNAKEKLSLAELLIGHKVLDRIMPDNRRAVPGTAHAMLNAQLPSGRRFRHSKTHSEVCYVSSARVMSTNKH